MVSTLGDPNGGGRGDFLLLDGQSFSPVGKWPMNGRALPFNYDFWYQPRRGLMLSTEWGSPASIKQGFHTKHLDKGKRINEF